MHTITTAVRPGFCVSNTDIILGDALRNEPSPSLFPKTVPLRHPSAASRQILCRLAKLRTASGVLDWAHTPPLLSVDPIPRHTTRYAPRSGPSLGLVSRGKQVPRKKKRHRSCRGFPPAAPSRGCQEKTHRTRLPSYFYVVVFAFPSLLQAVYNHCSIDAPRDLAAFRSRPIRGCA